ncbi:helix-turn-helix transcriptional regulator [Streptomyces sp. CBMA152]|uniref:ArsR/SmtB family transcription factor n=1 Tax=Streptomyces sp. CBMA152 TaxID=1896312 RepID=UPI00166144CB|nr:metalloregulator ArsR/SmtB family transcription factor [Streptomyces sp. CBMA152]
MKVQVASVGAAEVDRAVAVLRAAADPTRYRLLCLLDGQELPVSALAGLLGAQVAAVSQHLARLRKLGLVRARREGTRVYYRTGPAGIRRLLEDAALLADACEEGGHDVDPASSGRYA